MAVPSTSWNSAAPRVQHVLIGRLIRKINAAAHEMTAIHVSLTLMFGLVLFQRSVVMDPV